MDDLLGPKRKPGRPAESPEGPRSFSFEVRVTLKERNRIRKVAALEGRPASEMIREIVNRHVERRLKKELGL